MSHSAELLPQSEDIDVIPPEFFDCKTLFPQFYEDEENKPSEQEIQKWSSKSSFVVKSVGLLSKFWIKCKLNLTS